MYTQCPDCSAAFRVTADVLKQAVGKVRCGACGKAFSALEFLSETRPDRASSGEAEAPLPELTPDPLQSGTSMQRISPEQRATLLETLDRLAGPDIRIEDTGVEWRVLDEDGNEDGDDNDASGVDELLDESPTPIDELLTPTPSTVEAGEIFENPTNPFSQTIVDELRFDDDTPLPDDFDSDADASDVPEPSDADPDEADTDNENADQATVDDVDESGDEKNDWADILGEFDGPFEPAVAPLDAELAAIEEAERLADADTAHEEPAEASNANAGADSEANEDSDREPGEDAPEGDTVNQGLDDDSVPLEFGSIAGAASDPQMPPGDSDQDAVDGASFEGPDIDSDADEFWDAAAEFTGGKEKLITEVDSSPGFESIVMEGDFVRSELDKEKLAADMAAAEEIAEKLRSSWEAENTEATFGKPRGMMAAVVALVALLLVQIVHQSRDALATVPLFDSIVTPVYRAVGMPISPAWDITGWRLEATRGSADENNEQLTVYTRVGNNSERPAPYPLVGITLTDRFEETVGGRIVEPSEYLGGTIDLDQPVETGGSFDAVISIQSPPDDATGFKLKVCYPLSGGKLRCAVDAFK